jgi:hypothetical protein
MRLKGDLLINTVAFFNSDVRILFSCVKWGRKEDSAEKYLDTLYMNKFRIRTTPVSVHTKSQLRKEEASKTGTQLPQNICQVSLRRLNDIEV